MPFTQTEATNLLEATSELCDSILVELEKNRHDPQLFDLDELLEAQTALETIHGMLEELYNDRSPRPYDSAAGMAILSVERVQEKLRAVVAELARPFAD